MAAATPSGRAEVPRALAAAPPPRDVAQVSHFNEMKSWVGFGPDDERRLRALLPYARPDLSLLADRFYERILAHPSVAAVIRDDAQVERLKGTLRRWAEELLTGPWDDAYYLRRERIGRVHVEVGLPMTGSCGRASRTPHAAPPTDTASPHLEC